MNAPDTKPYDSEEIAREFLLGNLIKAASKRLKSLAIPYMDLKQGEQEMLLRELKGDIERAVREAVEIISSDYRVTFRATVEKVEFKADGVKSALSMFNSEAAYSLADVAGKTVMVVIEDASRYLEAGDATEGEPDQRSLNV